MPDLARPLFFSNDEYEIRPAKNTDEFRDMWWGFVQEMGSRRSCYDLDSFLYSSDSSGMLLLIHRLTKKPCGHITAIINANKTGWISMFIINAAHRGRGMGNELFKAAMAEFGRNGTRVVGLDSVVQQRSTYGRRGFVESPLGKVKVMAWPFASKEPISNSTEASERSGILMELQKVPYDLLAKHELQYTGLDRPRLWSDEHMFKRPDISGFALVRKRSPESVDDLYAWLLIRRWSGRARMGPLYARGVSSAKAVLVAAMKAMKSDFLNSASAKSDVPGDAVLSTEIWSGNPAATAVFRDLGWEDTGVSFHRMWADGKQSPEFSEGGAAQHGVFAVFDTAVG